MKQELNERLYFFLCGLAMGFGIAWGVTTWPSEHTKEQEKCAKCCEAAKGCGALFNEVVEELKRRDQSLKR